MRGQIITHMRGWCAYLGIVEDSVEKRGQLDSLGFNSRHLGGEDIALLPGLEQISEERAALLIGGGQISRQVRVLGLGHHKKAHSLSLAPGGEVHHLGGGLLLLLQAFQSKNLTSPLKESI